MSQQLTRKTDEVNPSANCKICLGARNTKKVKVDDSGFSKVYLEPCVCVIVERFKNRVGPDIFSAPTIKSSPWQNKLNENLFFTADKLDFLPHLKCSLWYAGVDFFFRLLTDIDLMDAWFSKEKQHRKTSEEEILTGTSGVAWSSLRDAVEDPTLLILFLGVATHTNKALPNVVQEAAKIRGHAGKPTWVITPRHHPFEEGLNNAWSEEGAAYFSANFKMVHLNKNDIARNDITPIPSKIQAGEAASKKTASGFLGTYFPTPNKK